MCRGLCDLRQPDPGPTKSASARSSPLFPGLGDNGAHGGDEGEEKDVPEGLNG